MTDETPDAKDVAARLSTLIDYVRHCDARAQTGEVLELGGLDRTVAALCQDIASLPPKEAHAQEAQMRKMVDALDSLAQSVRRQTEKGLSLQ